MKNRNELKKALLLSIKEDFGNKCKKKGLSSKEIKSAIMANTDLLEQSAEQILKDYDNFLLDSIAISIGNKIEKTLGFNSQNLSDSFSKITKIINLNHCLGRKKDFRG